MKHEFHRNLEILPECYYLKSVYYYLKSLITPIMKYFVVWVSEQFTFVGVLEMLCAYTMAGGSIRASRQLFFHFYSALLHAPMQFFDSTPRGRILNRVAEDVTSIDRVMPFTVRSMINCILSGFASLFVVTYATPSFLISFPVFAVVYSYIQVYSLLPVNETVACKG